MRTSQLPMPFFEGCAQPISFQTGCLKIVSSFAQLFASPAPHMPSDECKVNLECWKKANVHGPIPGASGIHQGAAAGFDTATRLRGNSFFGFPGPRCFFLGLFSVFAWVESPFFTILRATFRLPIQIKYHNFLAFQVANTIIFWLIFQGFKKKQTFFYRHTFLFQKIPIYFQKIFVFYRNTFLFVVCCPEFPSFFQKIFVFRRFQHLFFSAMFVSQTIFFAQKRIKNHTFSLKKHTFSLKNHPFFFGGWFS